MANVKFYLDVRRSKADGTSLLKIAVFHKRQTRYVSLPLSLLPEQWDASVCRVTTKHRQHRSLNCWLGRCLLDAGDAVFALDTSGRRGLSVSDYASAVSEAVCGEPAEEKVVTFAERLLLFASSPLKKGRTRALYEGTLSRIRAFDSSADSLTFEQIDKGWLMRFDAFLAQTSPSRNARNIHLRNIRAVFNAAIDDGVCSCYPFRRFKIRPQATVKRSLSVERLRELFSFPVESYAVRYLDAFKLIFCLCGINIIDLCNLRAVVDGRVEFYRAKTGRLYSIKIEPEAASLIEKYRGDGFLLEMLDHFSDYRSFMKQMNRALQSIGHVTRSGRGGKKKVEAAFPGLTSYWARHSWATIAASLEIPKETIAAALGHGGHSVTDIYIDFDRQKIDDANRRVLDWVFYGKK